MTGAERITAERRRQIDVEGYDAEHDDVEHAPGGLLGAAFCYIEFAYNQQAVADGEPAPDPDDVPPCWPWHASDWKPKDQIRNLERAGALIAAEIDRLLRAKAKS